MPPLCSGPSSIAIDRISFSELAYKIGGVGRLVEDIEFGIIPR